MSYPRETKEFQLFQVKLNGVEVFTDVEVVVLHTGVRPTPGVTTWTDPIVVDGKLAVMIDEFEPDTWNVWARVTSVPEIPVIYCGDFKVT
jgi:hypothetical protein